MPHQPISPICRKNVLTLAKAFAKHRGLKLTSVSSMCHGDPQFLERLAAPKGSVTTRKYDAVMAWFFSPKNWPSDLPYPEIKHPFDAAPASKAA